MMVNDGYLSVTLRSAPWEATWPSTCSSGTWRMCTRSAPFAWCCPAPAPMARWGCRESRNKAGVTAGADTRRCRVRRHARAAIDTQMRRPGAAGGTNAAKAAGAVAQLTRPSRLPIANRSRRQYRPAPERARRRRRGTTAAGHTCYNCAALATISSTTSARRCSAASSGACR